MAAVDQNQATTDHPETAGERALFHLLKKAAPGLLADLLESMSDEALLAFVDELPDRDDSATDGMDILDDSTS